MSKNTKEQEFFKAPYAPDEFPEDLQRVAVLVPGNDGKLFWASGFYDSETKRWTVPEFVPSHWADTDDTDNLPTN